MEVHDPSKGAVYEYLACSPTRPNARADAPDLALLCLSWLLTLASDLHVLGRRCPGASSCSHQSLSGILTGLFES